MRSNMTTYKIIWEQSEIFRFDDELYNDKQLLNRLPPSSDFFDSGAVTLIIGNLYK